MSGRGWFERDAARELLPSMIPPSYQRMVMLVGISDFLFLCAEWSGGGKYMPTFHHVTRKGHDAVSLRSIPERDG